MRIAFRTDASVRIGTGHVMRCLTLADALRERGAQCIFICRQHSGHLLDLIHQRGHQIQPLPAGGNSHKMQDGSTHAARLVATRLGLLRSHGITRDPALMTQALDGPWYYQQVSLGYNYRMTDMQAALAA